MKYFYFLVGLCFLFNNNLLSYNNEDKSNFNCPDLIVSELTVDDFSANSISYSFVIKNIGTVAANLDGPTATQSDNVSIQAFLSADTIFNNSGDIGAGRGFGLELYDVMGRQLNTWQVASNKATITVNYLSAGIYFLRIDSEIVKKFVVGQK